MVACEREEALATLKRRTATARVAEASPFGAYPRGTFGRQTGQVVRAAHSIGGMFAFLRGVVARKGPGAVELDVNGVGYEVIVPESTLRRLQTDATATLLTHCHIREDLFQIYGFGREEERALFRMLLTVQGIGPKVAMAVLSGISVAAFAAALRENDLQSLTRISGVGKKTAQRIILELKAKTGQDAELDAILGSPESAVDEEPDDVAAALTALGCTPAEAKRADSAARKELGNDAPVEELVKAALRTLRPAKQ